MTLEDIYNGHYDFNDEDDDDSDWDPLEKEVEVVKWFCVNCTMLNLSDVLHCDVRFYYLCPFYVYWNSSYIHDF